MLRPGRHAELDAVALGRADHRQGDARVAAGGLQNGLRPRQFAAAFGRFDHPRAGRSLTEPPGLLPSSLHNSRTPAAVELRFVISTSGVLPIAHVMLISVCSGTHKVVVSRPPTLHDSMVYPSVYHGSLRIDTNYNASNRGMQVRTVVILLRSKKIYYKKLEINSICRYWLSLTNLTCLIFRIWISQRCQCPPLQVKELMK